MSKLQERNVANERVYTVEEIAREARIGRTPGETRLHFASQK